MTLRGGTAIDAGRPSTNRSAPSEGAQARAAARATAVAPITGGTGEFLGATGTVTAGLLSIGGDFVITITN
ncbi:MAG: hypothetical protein ABSE58_00225 [Candidatus Limnocylindrales bacterium]